MATVDQLKALQAEFALGGSHLVELDEFEFRIAHTDAERAERKDLHECALHQWLASLEGPPKPLGLYVADPSHDGWVLEAF